MTDAEYLDRDLNEWLEGTLFDELRVLRSLPNTLAAVDLLKTPQLLRVLGGGEPTKAYYSLREFFENSTFNNVDVRTAELTIYWSVNAQNGRERLRYAAERLGIDPRNAVRYSDRGLREISKAIVRVVFDPDAHRYSEQGVGVESASSGRYRMIVRSRGWGQRQPDLPNSIRCDGKLLTVGNGKVVRDDDDGCTLEWTFGRRLPDAKRFKIGEVAQSWRIDFLSLGNDRLTFADRLNSRSFKVLFRTFGGIIYVDFLRQ